MTTETAVLNVERYVLMLRRGNVTDRAQRRYYAAIAHLKECANYMKYGNYDTWGRRENMLKTDEARHGADLTSMQQVLKPPRKESAV